MALTDTVLLSTTGLWLRSTRLPPGCNTKLRKSRCAVRNSSSAFRGRVPGFSWTFWLRPLKIKLTLFTSENPTLWLLTPRQPYFAGWLGPLWHTNFIQQYFTSSSFFMSRLVRLRSKTSSSSIEEELFLARRSSSSRGRPPPRSRTRLLKSWFELKIYSVGSISHTVVDGTCLSRTGHHVRHS